MHAQSRSSFLTAAAIFLVAGVAAAQGTNERPDVQIDGPARTEAITNLAKEVESNYPVATVGRTTANELRKRLAQNHFSETSAKALASKLTDELRSLTGTAVIGEVGLTNGRDCRFPSKAP